MAHASTMRIKVATGANGFLSDLEDMLADRLC
jgi:hypothetical protein